jgi:hypothetical protein
MSTLHQDIEKWRLDCLNAVQSAIQQENDILRSRLATLVGQILYLKEWNAVPVPVEVVGPCPDVGYSAWAEFGADGEIEAQDGVDTSLLVQSLSGWEPTEEAIEEAVAQGSAKTKRTQQKHHEKIRELSLAIARRFAAPQEVHVSRLFQDQD